MSEGASHEDQPLKVGDCVLIFGLESESGKPLNDQKGIVTGILEATGRLEVRLSPDKVVSLKALNLKKVELTVAERLKVLGLGNSGDKCEKNDRPTSEQEQGQEQQVPQSEPQSKEPQADGPAIADPAPGSCANNHGQRRDRSRSRSSSSSSSRSTTRHTGTSVNVGDKVEVFGLQSEGGRQLNGQRGCIVKHLTERTRFEVLLGLDRMVSLRPENLRKVDHAPNAVQPAVASLPQQAKPAESTPASLTSLLSMGRSEPEPEKPKPAVWESVWSRSGSTAPSGGLTNEQVEFFQQMRAEGEQREEEKRRLRLKVAAELAQAGAYDEEMLETVYQQELKDMELQRLLRPKEVSNRRSCSRSSSSSSSCPSSSGSRSRSRSPREKATDHPLVPPP